MTTREFKLLRNRARTAGEFRELAAWCCSTADRYRQRQVLVVHPLARHYAELFQHWTELSSLYLQKAKELESRQA
jgi:hypothetical protein